MTKKSLEDRRIRKNFTSQQNRLEKIRLVNNLKSKPCMDCKNSFPPVCMDFDHRPGVIKIHNVCDMIRRHCSVNKILEEIDKCDLVCSNCHRIRTALRGEYRS